MDVYVHVYVLWTAGGSALRMGRVAVHRWWLTSAITHVWTRALILMPTAARGPLGPHVRRGGAGDSRMSTLRNRKRPFLAFLC